MQGITILKQDLDPIFHELITLSNDLSVKAIEASFQSTASKRRRPSRDVKKSIKKAVKNLRLCRNQSRRMG
jgi:hypothetical protein